jgi:hypothetical protein
VHLKTSRSLCLSRPQRVQSCSVQLMRMAVHVALSVPLGCGNRCQAGAVAGRIAATTLRGARTAPTRRGASRSSRPAMRLQELRWHGRARTWAPQTKRAAGRMARATARRPTRQKGRNWRRPSVWSGGKTSGREAKVNSGHLNLSMDKIQVPGISFGAANTRKMLRGCGRQSRAQRSARAGRDDTTLSGGFRAASTASRCSIVSASNFLSAPRSPL